VATPVGAFPLQVTCFGEVATPGLSGTDGDDIIYGTAGDDVILGWAGNDTIYGLGGRDRICGGAGNDTIYGGPGGDLLDGEWGNDRVYGQGGNDGYVLGGDGNDILSPGAGSITYTGTVEGGAGRDRIIIDQEGVNDVFGGPGRDTIDFRHSPVGINVDLRYGQYLDATLTGNIGYMVSQVENVYGSEFDDYLRGNSRVNRLYGVGGDDHLFGYGGDDSLFGGAGDDYVNGGAGIGDWIEGNGGFDTCVDPDGFIVMDECEA
jgi:Ca2+-binding RTX toxin-like protein